MITSLLVKAEEMSDSLANDLDELKMRQGAEDEPTQGIKENVA